MGLEVTKQMLMLCLEILLVFQSLLMVVALVLGFLVSKLVIIRAALLLNILIMEIADEQVSVIVTITQ